MASRNHRHALPAAKWRQSQCRRRILVGAGRPIDYSRVKRIHEDDSIEVKYYDAHGNGGAGVSKMAFSYTVDIGCQYGGGVTCTSGQNKDNFFGMMLYDRTWFHNDLYAVTIGGGFMNNPGRYLALTPPDQRSDGRQRVALFHATARTEALSMGHAAESAVHAQGLDYLVDRSDVSAFERALLVGIGRRDASGRQYRHAGQLCRRRRRSHHRSVRVR